MHIDSELRSKETWLINEDGLWDICIGFSLLGFGLTITLNHPIWFIGFIMLAYFLVIMTGKEAITRPRMINFSIADGQLKKLAKWIRIGTGLIFLGLVIGAISFWVFDAGASISWLPDYGIKLLCISLSAILFMFGYLSRNGYRYYLYAVISCLAFIIFEMLNYSSISFVFSAALLLTISGIGFLLWFVTRYPKAKARENVQL
jgi:hypothetical protein